MDELVVLDIISDVLSIISINKGVTIKELSNELSLSCNTAYEIIRYFQNFPFGRINLYNDIKSDYIDLETYSKELLYSNVKWYIDSDLEHCKIPVLNLNEKQRLILKFINNISLQNFAYKTKE